MAKNECEKPVVIQTWNKLWSRCEKHQTTLLATSRSIHPGKALGRARATRAVK